MNSLVQSHKNRLGYLKLRLHASGDFTIGVNSPPRKDAQQSNATAIETVSWWNGYRYVSYIELSTDQQAIARYVESRYPGALTDEQVIELFNTYEAAGDYDRALQLVDSLATRPQDSMGLSVATNSHNLRSRVNKMRGQKGVTPYGKRMVRSAAVLLEEKFGRRCLTLGTCTLPALEPEEFGVVCRAWSELTRQFFQELQRLLARRGLSTNYVQVSEIQEKRFERWGQVAPHLHWIVQGRKSPYSQWAIVPSEVSSLWERLLSGLLGRSVDGKAATRIENPRKSLAAEMGKYLSKGCKVVESIHGAGLSDHLPSAWWGCSRPLKAEVKRRIIEDTGDLADFLYKNLEVLQRQGKIRYRFIYLELTDPKTGIRREVKVGAVGYFTSQAARNEVLGSVAFEVA